MPISGSSQAVVVPGTASAATGPTTYFLDTFTRSVSPGWGTADTGQTWSFRSGAPSNTACLSVNGTQGIYDGRGQATTAEPGVDLSTLRVPFCMTWRMLFPTETFGSSMEFDFQYTVGNVLQTDPYGYFVINEGIHATGSPKFLWIGGFWQGRPPVGASSTTHGFSGFNDGPDAYVGVDQSRWIQVRINVEAQKVRAAVWYDGEPEPVDDQIVFDQFNAVLNGWDLTAGPSLNRFEVVPFGSSGTFDGPYYFDDFKIVSGSTATPSTVMVDTFARSTTAGTPGTVNTPCATLGSASSGITGTAWTWGSQYTGTQTSQCTTSPGSGGTLNAVFTSAAASDQGYRITPALWSRHVLVACQAKYTGTGSGAVEFNFGTEGLSPNWATPTGFSVPTAAFDWVSSNLGNFNDHSGAFSTNGPLFCTGQTQVGGVFSESSTMGPLPKNTWVNLEVEMVLPHQAPAPNTFPGATGFIRSRAWPVGGMKPGWQCRASLTVNSSGSLQYQPYLEMEILIRANTTTLEVRNLTVSPTSPPDPLFHGALIYTNTGNANAISTATTSPAIWQGALAWYDSDGFVQPFDLSTIVLQGGGYVIPPGLAGVYRIVGNTSYQWYPGTGPATSGYIRFFIAITRSGTQYNLAEETIGFTEANQEIAGSSNAAFRNIEALAQLQDGDCVQFYGENQTSTNWLYMDTGPNIGPGAPTPLPFFSIERLGTPTVHAGCVFFDTFSRTVASGWGTSDYGTAWSISRTTALGVSSVDGTTGLGMVGVQNGTFPNTQGSREMLAAFPTQITGAYSLKTRGYFNNIPQPPNGAATSYFYFVNLPDGRSWDIDIATSVTGTSATAITLELLDASFNTITSASQTVGTNLTPNTYFDITVNVTATSIQAIIQSEATGFNIFNHTITDGGTGSLIGANQSFGASTNVISNDNGVLFALYTDFFTLCPA